MMRFVETKADVEKLLKTLSDGECFIQMYWKHHNLHPIQNEPLLLMIRHFSQEDEVFVVSFSHPDCITMNLKILEYIGNTECIKYVMGRKDMMHIANFANCKDVELSMYSNSLKIVDIGRIKCNDTRSIPIMNISKKFKSISNQYKTYIKTEGIDEQLINYEHEFSPSLKEIESNGIYTSIQEKDKLESKTDSRMVYSQYNMKTPTGRPSNRFGGINFAALNKKTGERDKFVSRYGSDGAIVMMDYESYHLRLFGNYINYDLPNESLHEYLGKLYHGKSELSEEEYELSKKITFNLIFGGISEDVSDNVPFMAKISDYVKNLWDFYQKNDFIETWFYKRKLHPPIFGDKINPYKIFNYQLQSAETERNCKVMKILLRYLQKKQTKLILYTYDAFLFDMPSSEFIEVKKLANLMNEGGKYPVRTYVGASYGNLREVRF